MGKDAKAAGGKGKGKQPASSSDDSGGKGKRKNGKAADGLGTCTYVKARHVLCEKHGKINEAYKKLDDGWLSNGYKVPPAEFAKIAAEYSVSIRKERRGPGMVSTWQDGGPISGSCL